MKKFAILNCALWIAGSAKLFQFTIHNSHFTISALCFLLCSCNILPKPPKPPAPPAPVVTNAAVWSAVQCDEFCSHGYPEENDVRMAAINAAAAAQPVKAVQLKAQPDMSFEVAVRVLRYPSEVDGHYVENGDNFWCIADRMGVKRWVHWCDRFSQANAERWNFICRSPDNRGRTQWLVTNTSDAVLQWMRAAAATNGIEVCVLPTMARRASANERKPAGCCAFGELVAFMALWCVAEGAQ